MADTLTSRQIIQKPDIIIDPNFFAPPGVVDAYHGEVERDRVGRYGDQGGGSGDGNVTIVDPEESQEPSKPGGSLMPPTGMRIIKQTKRFNQDGSYVIDAVLGFDAVPGAARYEIRLTKLER